MRRNERTFSALVAMVFVWAVLCPCPPMTGPRAASAHDCCAPAAIHPVETRCCVDAGPATSKATPLAAPAPVVPGRMALAVLPAPRRPLAAAGFLYPPMANPSPPLVLRA